MADQPKSFVELSLIKQGFPSHNDLLELARIPLDRDEIPHAQIEDLLRTINRRFDRFALKPRAMYLYTNNRIHLLGNKEGAKVPVFLPAWRIRGDKGVQSLVNAVPYVPAGGPGSIDVRRLFGLLLYGQVLVDVIASWGKLSNATGLCRSGAAVYSRMMFKAIDRVTGAGTDRMRSDQLKFVLSKYFLVNIMGSRLNEQADQIASSLTSGTAMNALLSFEEALDRGPQEEEPREAAGAWLQGSEQRAPEVPSDKGEPPKVYSLNLLDFLHALAKCQPWMARMTARGFLQTFAQMYNPQALLAAEDAGYFFATLANHQAGSEIISSFSFDPVFGDDGAEAIAEFARLCSA